jgi:hypothetical protein
VLNGHGAPGHSIAINEACDFISETLRVTMLHLSGLFKADAAIQARGEKIKARYFSPRRSRPSAWMSMPAWTKRRPFSPFARISFV